MGSGRIQHRKKGVSIELLDALLKEQTRLRRDSELFRDIRDIFINHYPGPETCSVDDVQLLVRKTTLRDVRSASYPPFTARGVHLYCPICKRIFVPVVTPLTRGNSPFSMDVVVHAGMMKFLYCRRRDEVQDELMDRFRVYASDGTISAISMEFLARLKCLHELRFDRIVRDILADGGYILGMDGTGDGGSDRILACMDLLRDWVLLSARIPSEKDEHMKPHVEHIKAKLGLPLASLCDMQSGMMGVLQEVMTGSPLRTCHYHFLDDIGRDLMKEDYMAARELVINSKLLAYLKRLRKKIYHEPEMSDVDIASIARDLRTGVVPSGMSVAPCISVQAYDVLSWVLRHTEDNKGMRFPYVLPYLNLYERCQTGLEAVTALRRTAAEGRTSPKYLRELEDKMRDVLEGQDEEAKTLRARTASLKESYGLFETLRERLRVPKDKGDIPRDKLLVHSNEMIAKMKKELEDYREGLRKVVADGKHPKERIVLEHLDKYWSHIVLENVAVNVNGKEVMIEIPRTTSGNESCFGMMKSDVRKRLGKKDIGRELNRYGDYLCYVQNLKREDYVRLVCGTIEDLPRAFEEIPEEMLKEEMDALRTRMKGYDITNSGRSGKRVEIDDIMLGVKAVEKRIEDVKTEEYLRPPELYGCKSNGILTL